MPLQLSRRKFIVAGMGALAASASVPAASLPRPSQSESARLAKSPFKISVITDEISQDFGHACEVASRQFDMGWVEIRELWNKNSTKLDPTEIAEASRLLKKYTLKVTDVASPLFKVDWPGAPKSKFSPEHDQFGASFTYSQQGEVLDRCIELAKQFSTDRIRCFDFWRLEDQAPSVTATAKTLSKQKKVLNGLRWAQAPSIGSDSSPRSSETAIITPSASKLTGMGRVLRKLLQ